VSYSKAIKQYEEKAPQVRTNYACKAFGCPNTGSVDGDVCFYHSQASSDTWHRVTQDIRENFDAMRNWGSISPELQSKRKAEAQKKFGQTGRAPTGLQSGAA